MSLEGNEKITKILINHGADVNSKGAHFCSALHLTAIKGLDLQKFVHFVFDLLHKSVCI